MDIQKRLFDLQDTGYRDFQSRLMPTVDPETVIGVRTPQLRKLAKELAKAPDIELFLGSLPHRYYEENNLHAFILGEIRDFDACAAGIHNFLPYVDNWATCDSMNSRAFAKHADRLPVWIERWLDSGQTYAVRYGIVTLMRYFLKERFDAAQLERVASIRHEDYYVKMAAAWYFATALALQYDAALPFIEQRRLERWTHNKAIQKACESFRISQERKAYLRGMKE